MSFSLKKIFYPEYWATFLLVLFCIRYIPLESRAGPSLIKTAVSAICLILVVRKYSQVTKAMFWGLAYFGMIFLSATIHYDTFRWSTILYLFSFIITYICFYNLLWVQQVFTLDRFLKIVKYFIYAYIIALLIQQCFILIGIKYFPLVNLCQILNRGLGANSLSGEPSTAGRILTVLVYAYIKCTEYRQGTIVTLRDMFDYENKWVSFGYIYAVLTMGSGTVFLCIAILSLYFLRLRYSVFVIPLYIGIYFFMSQSDNESFHRVTAAVEATITNDTEEVTKTDMSAATRINPMLNTINNLNFSETETWIGHGIDWSLRPDIKRSGQRMIGDIGDYGFIAYLLSLCFVFSCAITPISLATIMFFLGVGGGTGNIAYFWGILMVFTTIRYFHDNLENTEIYEDSSNPDVETDNYE